MSESALSGLLTQYRDIRTETRDLERDIQRQTFVAVIIVGTIFGYALSTRTLWLLLVVPVIIGYFIAIIGHTWISVMFFAYHARSIEARIDVPAFCWETKYGEVWNDNERVVLSTEKLPLLGHLNWSEFPKQLTFGLVAFLYLSAIGIAILVLALQTPDPWQLQAIIVAFLGYTMYSVLIGLVAKASQAVENDLNCRSDPSNQTHY